MSKESKCNGCIYSIKAKLIKVNRSSIYFCNNPDKTCNRETYNEQEIKIKHELLKKHSNIETKILSEKEKDILNNITNYINYAYDDLNFDEYNNEILTINLFKDRVFINYQNDIEYCFYKNNKVIYPIINFLKYRGYSNGSYVSLHGFKYTFRLLRELDRLNDLYNICELDKNIKNNRVNYLIDKYRKEFLK